MPTVTVKPVLYSDVLELVTDLLMLKQISPALVDLADLHILPHDLTQIADWSRSLKRYSSER
jgi:hypothetical protein